MKKSILVICLLFSIKSYCQSPYTFYTSEKMSGFRSMFDDIPINKGQEKDYYDYAVKLLQQDSIQKAGQIFDRVYWLDTVSEVGKKAITYRISIEQKILKSVNML